MSETVLVSNTLHASTLESWSPIRVVLESQIQALVRPATSPSLAPAVATGGQQPTAIRADSPAQRPASQQPQCRAAWRWSKRPPP